MKYSCFLYLALASALISCSTSKRKQFIELDKAIQNSDIYEQAYSCRMDSLRIIFREAEDDSSRWDAAYDLQKKYFYHDIDSCHRYTIEMMRLSARDKHKRSLSEACYSRILFRMDSIRKAKEIFDAIDTTGISGDFINIYFSNGNRIYRELEKQDNRYKAIRNNLIEEWWSRDSLNIESVYIHNRVYHATGEYDKAIEQLQACFDDKMSLNDYAKGKYCIATEYIKKNDEGTAIPYLIESAIADCELSVKAYDALYNLSLILFRHGDIKRADRYMRITLQDAEDAHYAFRIKDVVQAEMQIMDAMLNQEKKRQRSFVIATISITLLLLLASASAALLLRYSRRLNRSRMRLDEVSKIKDGFLALYMERCVDYLNKVDEYRSSLRKAVKQDGPEAAMAMLRKPSFAAEEFDGLLTSFDSTFLGIFPDFVEKVNEMMQDGHKLEKPADASLSTDLRILALIRLGINKRPRIAKILNMSVTTVYSYHCNLQKRSTCPDDFDKVIAKL